MAHLALQPLAMPDASGFIGKCKRLRFFVVREVFMQKLETGNFAIENVKSSSVPAISCCNKKSWYSSRAPASLKEYVKNESALSAVCRITPNRLLVNKNINIIFTLKNLSNY